MASCSQSALISPQQQLDLIYGDSVLTQFLDIFLENNTPSGWMGCHFLELVTWLEHATFSLRVRCTTDCSTLARLHIISIFSGDVNSFLDWIKNGFSEKNENTPWQIVCYGIEYSSCLEQTWRSRVAGRARTIGNRVYPKRVSRVQIPPSPP